MSDAVTVNLLGDIFEVILYQIVLAGSVVYPLKLDLGQLLRPSKGGGSHLLHHRLDQPLNIKLPG